ncbi:YodC family protein [Pseudomonas sp. YQ_13]|uniref:YodC family protein n=1 Tax=Pseudomonas TaxID=286 RepID=UPI00370C8C07
MPKETLFNIGDLVRIKSGGPVMTVNSVTAGGLIFVCQWFAGKKLESGRFPAEALLQVEEDSK